mmetsp:Transcript_2393/g.3324  ORF Transcript_2393/g.3324 Transcript_2393/m.3324 type:complete len:112 (-) Transcript_2393:161-496(-)
MLEKESRKDKETICWLTSALIRMQASFKDEKYKREKLKEENLSMTITLNNLVSNENKLVTSLRNQEDNYTKELLKEIEELRLQIQSRDVIIASLKKYLEQLRDSLTRPRRR